MNRTAYPFSPVQCRAVDARVERFPESLLEGIRRDPALDRVRYLPVPSLAVAFSERQEPFIQQGVPLKHSEDLLYNLWLPALQRHLLSGGVVTESSGKGFCVRGTALSVCGAVTLGAEHYLDEHARDLAHSPAFETQPFLMRARRGGEEVLAQSHFDRVETAPFLKSIHEVLSSGTEKVREAGWTRAVRMKGGPLHQMEGLEHVSGYMWKCSAVTRQRTVAGAETIFPAVLVYDAGLLLPSDSSSFLLPQSSRDRARAIVAIYFTDYLPPDTASRSSRR